VASVSTQLTLCMLILPLICPANLALAGDGEGASAAASKSLPDGRHRLDLGDSLVQAQYSPAGHITASPWIPDNVGLSGSLLIPTGDPKEGLSADNWELELGLGWSFNAVRSLWLIPATYYLKSLKEGSLGIPVEELGFSVELRWLFENGVWFGYRPNLARDLLGHEWADDHSLVLGKMFSNGFGLGLEYGRADRLDKMAQRDDYVGVFNVYYQFGRAL
jgi:hypothetical protein